MASTLDFCTRTKTKFSLSERRIIHILLILPGAFLLALLPYNTSESASKPLAPLATHEITLVFAGDIMQHMPQVDAA